MPYRGAVKAKKKVTPYNQLSSFKQGALKAGSAVQGGLSAAGRAVKMATSVAAGAPSKLPAAKKKPGYTYLRGRPVKMKKAKPATFKLEGGGKMKYPKVTLSKTKKF